MNGFIKLNRTPKVSALMRSRPTALLLLMQIAIRARRTNENTYDGLEVGQAKIGDYQSYGVTQQTYRLDKQCLKVNNLATFKGTNKGTIATLLSSDIFDINSEEGTSNRTGNRTNKERTKNEQATTNKNDKNDKNERNKEEEETSSPNKVRRTRNWFLKNKEELIAKAQGMHPTKDARKCAETFIEKTGMKQYGYSDYWKAYLNWLGTDRFNEYARNISGSETTQEELMKLLELQAI